MKTFNSLLLSCIFTAAGMSFASATTFSMQCPTLGSNAPTEGFIGQAGQVLHNVNITEDPNNKGRYRIVCDYPGQGHPTQMTWSGLVAVTPYGAAWNQYGPKYQCVQSSADQCQFTLTTN